MTTSTLTSKRIADIPLPLHGLLAMPVHFLNIYSCLRRSRGTVQAA